MVTIVTSGRRHQDKGSRIRKTKNHLINHTTLINENNRPVPWRIHYQLINIYFNRYIVLVYMIASKTSNGAPSPSLIKLIRANTFKIGVPVYPSALAVCF